MPALFAVISVALEIIGHFRLHQENRRRIVRDRIDIHVHAAVFAHDEDAEIIGQGGEVALRMQGIEDIEAGRRKVQRQRAQRVDMQGRAADGVAAYRVAPGAARGAEARVMAQLLRIPDPQDGDIRRAAVVPHLVERRAPLPNRFTGDGRQRPAHPDAVQVALVVAQRARGDAAERGTACRIEIRKIACDKAAQGGDARLVLRGQLFQVAAGRPDIGQGDVIEFQPVDAELVFQAENLCLIVF